MLDVARFSRWSRLWIIITIVGGLYLVYMTYFAFFTPKIVSETRPTMVQHRCHWKEGDPVVFHLRTKMGVNYDAGHWFHMAENFMVQHSILRSVGELTNSTNVILNFDEDHFINNLNGITRLMVYLGTHGAQSSPQQLYYTHLTYLPWSTGHARVGSSVVINHHDFNEIQMLDFAGNAEAAKVSNRFVSAAKHSHWPRQPHTARRLQTNASTAVEILSPATPVITMTAADGASTTHNLRSVLQTEPSAHSSSMSLQSNGGVVGHHDTSHQLCARYMGTIGGNWPTVQRGHWFPNDGDIESFRDTLRQACPPDAELLKQTAKKKKYKMVVYQRDLSRKLANQDEAINAIRAKLGDADWDIEVLMHKSSRSPCTLMHHLYNADILVTPHGFQSMLLLFLPRPALMFEVFPYKYYKRGYGPFGGEYGVTHGGTMSPATAYYQQLVLPYVTTAWCMESKFCRGFARDQDVLLTTHGVNSLIAFIEQHKALLSVGPHAADVIASHPSLQQAARTADKNRDFLYY